MRFDKLIYDCLDAALLSDKECTGVVSDYISHLPPEVKEKDIDTAANYRERLDGGAFYFEFGYLVEANAAFVRLFEGANENPSMSLYAEKTKRLLKVYAKTPETAVSLTFAVVAGKVEKSYDVKPKD